MANKNPSVGTRFRPNPEKLASKAISVRLPETVDAIVRSLPNYSDWLRAVIAEAVEKLQQEREGK
jgi:hypothetical protein